MPERYVTRGKFSQQKFEAECLAEYAATFPVVCGDFAFYQFPSPDYWKRLFRTDPGVVPVRVQGARRHHRGPVAEPRALRPTGGSDNEAFLDADLFGTSSPAAWSLMPAGRPPDLRVRDVPASRPSPSPTISSPGSTRSSKPSGGFRYAIEIRNPEYLGPTTSTCSRVTAWLTSSMPGAVCRS